jgi:PHD/YefM family antitoxin component YafN of YafNO toxin-antitoxin module
MTRTISATLARKDFFKLIDQADRPGASIGITVDGEMRVVMMSAGEYEGWLETLEIMSDPELMKGIEQGMKEYRQGKTIPMAQVKKLLKLK